MMQAELDFVTPPWPKISAAAKDCVRQLLTVQAQSRPSASELLQVSMSKNSAAWISGISTCRNALLLWQLCSQLPYTHISPTPACLASDAVDCCTTGRAYYQTGKTHNINHRLC